MNHLEMECPQLILSEESHVNFCMLYPNQNPFIPKLIKQNLHQPSLSLTLIKHSKSHEPIIQEEVNYEYSYDEAIEFDEESDREIEIELEIDPVEQGLINAYPYWSDREKELKEKEVRSTMCKISNYKRAR